MPRLRIDRTSLAVLRLLIETPDELCGSQVMEQTGLRGGTVYPILHRFNAAGWLESRIVWPDSTPKRGRPWRRCYKLAGKHRQEAVERVNNLD